VMTVVTSSIRRVILPTAMALILALLLLSPETALAAFVNPAIGGSGGNTNYNLDCGPNAVMVGINGKYGSWIDSMSVVCRGINADGSLGNMRTLGPTGGTGGNNIANSVCAADSVVTGMNFYWGLIVDRTEVHCRPWLKNRLMADPSTSSPSPSPLGPSIDTSIYDSILNLLNYKLNTNIATKFRASVSCTSLGEYVATGMRGRSGNFLDSASLVCDTFSLPAPPPAIIIKGPVSPVSPVKQLPDQLTNATVFCNLPIITVNVSPATVVVGQQSRVSVTFNCQRREESVVKIQSSHGIFNLGENLVRIPAGKTTGETYARNLLSVAPVTASLTAVLEGVPGAVPSKPAFLRILPRP